MLRISRFLEVVCFLDPIYARYWNWAKAWLTANLARAKRVLEEGYYSMNDNVQNAKLRPLDYLKKFASLSFIDKSRPLKNLVEPLLVYYYLTWIPPPLFYYFILNPATYKYITTLTWIPHHYITTLSWIPPLISILLL